MVVARSEDGVAVPIRVSFASPGRRGPTARSASITAHKVLIFFPTQEDPVRAIG